MPPPRARPRHRSIAAHRAESPREPPGSDALSDPGAATPLANHLAALHQAARELAIASTQTEIFDTIGRHALAMCHGRVWAGLYDAATDTIDAGIWLQDGLRLTAWERSGPAGAGLGGEVARSGLTIATPDYAAECRHRGVVSDEPLPAGSRHKMPWLGVPLISGANVLGVLCAYKQRGEACDPAVIKLLETLAGHASTALANAQLRAVDSARQRQLEARALESAASEDQLHTLQDAMACGVMVVSAEWAVLRMNPSAELILGWTLAELAGRPLPAVWDAVQEDGSRLPIHQAPLSVALDTGEYLRSQVLGVRGRDGQHRWLQIDAVPALHADGSMKLVVCTFVDITARKLAQKTLHEDDAHYRLLFDRNPHPMWVIEEGSLRFLAVNEAAIRHYGYTREEFLATTARSLHAPDRVAALVAEVSDAAEDRQLARPWRHRKKDGSLIHVEVYSHRLTFAGRRARMAVVTDMTDRKQAEEALAHQAMHDMLTDLPNRVLLQDRLRKAIQTGQRDGSSVALLVMDLDRFKEVNDSFGHLYGDLLLQQVSVRLQSALRGADTLARLGGDEFAVLLPVADQPSGMSIVLRLQQVLEEPFVIEGQQFTIGASIGLAVCPEHAPDSDTLLQCADVAMYVAKRSGSRYAVYMPKDP